MASFDRKCLFLFLHGAALYSIIRSFSLHKDVVDGHFSNHHLSSFATLAATNEDEYVLQAERNEAPIKEIRSDLSVEADMFQICNTSLNEMVIDMAKYSAPQGSTAWTKMKRILSQAKYYHIPDQENNIFHDSTKKIIDILDGYGLVRIKNETINSDAIVLNNDTILVEYSIYNHDVQPSHCIGSKCNAMPRISLQTEQIRALRWAPDFIRLCNSSPNCILWDFSKVNYDWAKISLNASESIMIVPLLFHDRLQELYPNGDDELLPYPNRTVDITFFGLITKRRKEFQQRYIGGNNKTLSMYKVQYRKLMFLGAQVDAYRTSKICLVLHAYIPDSAGEYHRISDFKRFGCIPVMESFSDIETQRTLEACAGMVFADYENLASTAVSVLNKINETDARILRRNQLKVDRWWRQGIQWNTFLETVLGP